MAYEFPTENLIPGQIEEVPQADGSVIRYQWTDPPGVWKILGSGGGGSGGGGPVGPITTADVLTMGTRPNVVSSPFDANPGTLQTQQNANWYLEDAKVDRSGDTMTGRLSIKKEREDKNSIALSIAGRIRNGDGDVVDDVLFKSYQRIEGDSQPDYIAYYGSTGGANEILNRVTAQQEFAAKGTFDGSVSDLEQRVADGETTQDQIKEAIADALIVQANKVDKSGDTMTGRLNAPRIAVDSDTESGRVFEAKFQGETNAWINANGQVRSNFVLDDDAESKTLTTKQYVDDKIDDAEYLPLTGGTIQGQVYFDVNADGVHNIGIAPRDADDTSVIYSMNGGICRLRSLAGNNINSTDVRTHFGWGRNTDGDPETVLYHLKDPTDTLHAANKRYVDNNYLALSGGDMTGTINIDRSSGIAIDISKDGQENLKLWADGTVSTTKTTFNNDNFVTKTYVDTLTGDYIDKTGTNVVTTSWKISGNSKTFIQNSSNTLGLYNLKAPSESHHAARKQDLDAKVPGRFYMQSGSLYYEV